MKIGMIFTDYGNQFVGMGKELYDHSRIVQEYFEEASNCLNINFVKLCFASSDTELAKITHAYASIFLTSVSIAALLKEQGINPDVVAGYGLGEYSALCSIGGINFPDGLYFLNKYAQLYHDALAGMSVSSLRVIGLDYATLQQICTHAGDDPSFTYITASLSSQDHIISGTKSSISIIEQILRAQNPLLSFQDVPVEAGLHNKLMIPIIDHLKMYLVKIDFKDTIIPLISTLDAQPLTQAELIKDSVVKQLHEPILWNKTMDKLAQEIDIIIEIGPGNNLQKLLVENAINKQCISINKQEDIDELHKLLAQKKGI